MCLRILKTNSFSGHLCDNLVSLLDKFSPAVVTESAVFVPMFRHFFSEAAVPKLTSPATLQFARRNIAAFADRVDANVRNFFCFFGWLLL